GLVQNRTKDLLTEGVLSGILTEGGTILGTSLQVPFAMKEGDEKVDRTQEAVDAYKQNKLDALVCIGDKSSQMAAYKLSQAGLNVISMPRSAENDVPCTDKCIGFDSAREI